MFQVGGLWFGVGSVHMHFFSPLVSIVWKFYKANQ